MVFLTLLLIPILIALGFFIFFQKDITWQEFGLHIVAQLIIAGVSAALIYHMSVVDTEIWNGSVQYKKSEKVHCRHSYPCRCRSVSCGKNCTTTHCDTCYRHSYDIDWNVYSNIGSWTIDPIDSQGLKEPPRWTAVKFEDPVVKANQYTNYIKGAPSTLFRYSGEEKEFTGKLLPYTQNVFDYYRLNRIFTVGYTLSDRSRWEQELSKVNSITGYNKGCNIVLFFTDQPSKYFYALTQRWLGGKKNDIVVVIGVEGENIVWTNVMAWTDNSIFKVKLVDELLAQKTVDLVGILSIIERNTQQYYIRKSMDDFKYLQASILPTPRQWIAAMLIGTLISIGLGIYFVKYELTT